MRKSLSGAERDRTSNQIDLNPEHAVADNGRWIMKITCASRRPASDRSDGAPQWGGGLFRFRCQ